MVFFNSRHAGATQDHFHLQALLHASQLPIQKAEQKSCEGGPVRYVGAPYPINALVYLLEDKERCCESILKLQARGVPFNLIFLKGRLFLVPRDINNEIVCEFPNVLGSMEVSGKFIISGREAFEKASEERIRTALGRTGLAIDDIAAMLRICRTS
jgi:hypothetical protein